LVGYDDLRSWRSTEDSPEIQEFLWFASRAPFAIDAHKSVSDLPFDQNLLPRWCSVGFSLIRGESVVGGIEQISSHSEPFEAILEQIKISPSSIDKIIFGAGILDDSFQVIATAFSLL